MTQFVAQVAAARRLEPSRVAAVAEGRAWLGVQARERQLVDSLGGWDGAVAAMKRKLGVGADEELELRRYPARDSWLERLLAGEGLREAAEDAVLGESVRELAGAGRWRHPAAALLSGGDRVAAGGLGLD